ncbi:MAG TPA: cell wall hydrolase [Sphingomonadaceae bacterium]|nr:cell wall hydrolase [Sphingomonadaceae bacterium]
MTLHVPSTLRAYPREAFGLLLLLVAAALALFGLFIAPSDAFSGPALANTPQALALGRPPAPQELRFRPVTPDDARTINAVMPFSDTPNPAAHPLAAKFEDKMDEARALDCLTAAVYYEAAIEAADGQRAVAQVVLNRLRHPAYPKTICGVVFQGSERSTGCQFTFTCDGAMGRAPNAALWTRAREIAWAALSGQVFAPVGWATHYHTDWVVPYWASSLAKNAKIGTHIFYRWEGGWGRPRAFTGRYASVEPLVPQLAVLSGAHGKPLVDVAVAAGDALDALALNDEIVVEAAPAAKTTEQLNALAAVTPAALAAAKAGTLIVAKTASAVTAAPDVPSELRWALSGTGAAASEPALGAKAPVASKESVPAKACDGDVKTATRTVPSGKGDGAVIKVRERC